MKSILIFYFKQVLHISISTIILKDGFKVVMNLCSYFNLAKDNRKHTWKKNKVKVENKIKLEI